MPLLFYLTCFFLRLGQKSLKKMLFFWKIWRHQKDILKLNDLYFLIHLFGLKTKRQIVDCHSGQFSQQIHYSRRIASVYCWKMELTISFLLEWVIINNKKKERVAENINRRLVFESMYTLLKIARVSLIR